MSTGFKVTVKCPVCGHENKAWFDLVVNGKKQFKYCDSDTGGCDDEFAFELTATVTAKTAVTSDFLTAEEHAHDKALRERE